MAQVGNWSRLKQAREQSFYADAALAVARAEQAKLQTRERLVRLMGLPGADPVPARAPARPAGTLAASCRTSSSRRWRRGWTCRR
jgi:outer membrane protein TolC